MRGFSINLIPASPPIKEEKIIKNKGEKKNISNFEQAIFSFLIDQNKWRNKKDLPITKKG